MSDLCHAGVTALNVSAGEEPRVILTKDVIPHTLSEAAAMADRLERAIPEDRRSESVRMLLSIARQESLGAQSGWFGPAQSTFDFGSLVRRWGPAPEGGFSIDSLADPVDWLVRLDRNQDGRLTAGDLDWSDENAWVQQSYVANRFFRRLNRHGDGQLTAPEWQAFFDTARCDAVSLSFEAFRDALIGSGPTGGLRPGDVPSAEALLIGLANGELGSLQEGPRPGETAPDFSLPLLEGTGSLALSSLWGDRPTVLVFGNYTCGPFRSMYPGVEAVANRFRDRANCLWVYVREAHPCNGWCMSSNDTAGIHVEQPLDNAARMEIAKACRDRLQPTIPVVVDSVDDVVGDQYSAMPARLYVLDKAGQVTYQSGRGPFGFKVGEMEQALVLTLLDDLPLPSPQPIA